MFHNMHIQLLINVAQLMEFVYVKPKVMFHLQEEMFGILSLFLPTHDGHI